METSDEDYRKYLVWQLEQTYTNSDSTIDNLSEIKDTISSQLDIDQLRLDTAINQIEDLVKDKQFAYKESVEFAVKKTLAHFPEHSDRTTRIIDVPGHGDFMIDLATGEFLDGKKFLYDDWIDGKLAEPKPPEPKKINPKRLVILLLPGLLCAWLILLSAANFLFSNFGSLEVDEYRFVKQGQTHETK